MQPNSAAPPPPEPPHPAPQPRWNATTKIIIVVLLIALTLAALALFRVALVPMIIGGVLAYAMTPFVRSLSAHSRLPRGVATAAVYLVLLIVVLPLPALIVPWIVRQAAFLQGELINFVAYLNEISSEQVQVLGFELVVGDLTAEAMTRITELITSAAPASLAIVFGAAESLLMVIFTFLIAFYLTRDAEHLKGWLKGLVPAGYQRDASLLLHEVDAIWSAFLRGQVTLALVVAALLTAVSALLGLPQPLLLGVLGGLLEFLPSVGHAVWLITASILALVEGSSTLPVSNLVFLIIVLGAHTAYTQFDLNYLIPRIIGRQVHLHPMVVILGIILGATAGHLIGGGVGSVLGIALAAPTIASLRVLGRYVYARLLDLDPFPMVGPPAAPRAVRQQVAAEQSAGRAQPALTVQNGVLGPLRRLRGEPPASEPPPAPKAEN